MTTKRFVALGLLLAVLLAVVATFAASGRPDGLEYVADQTGIGGRAEGSPALQLNGLAGLLLVLVISGGLFWALRRRDPADDTDQDRG